MDNGNTGLYTICFDGYLDSTNDLKNMTQHDRIIEMCSDNDWHCQNDFHPITWSPHKRRGEIEKKTDKNGNKLYEFYERPCEHGIQKSKDFLLVFLNPPKSNPSNYRCHKCPYTAVTYLEDKPVCLEHSKKKVESPSLF